MQSTNTNEHRKYYNKMGVEVPSCTSIVKLLDKPQLVTWANNLGFKHINAKKLLEEKASRGTYIHALFERYFSDGLISTIDNDGILTREEYKEIIFKFRMIELYFEKLGIEVLRNELVLEGSEYGGTCDMLCYNRTKDCLMLFDLKSSKSIYDSHWMQLMGYADLIEEIYQIPVTEVGVILISKPLKSPELINIRTAKDCWRERYIFQKLKEIYYFQNKPPEEIASLKEVSYIWEP
jgi:hypothetical protein